MAPESRPNRPTPSELTVLIDSFAQRADEMIKTAQPYSFQEYLGLAAKQALQALREGNYGIGAIYVYRQDGKEFVIGGRNGLISRGDTHLHAEQDAIDAAESFAREETTYADRVLFIRDAPHAGTERFIVTSLEPCPMCAGRITTHRLDKVLIGAEDPPSGAMLGEREKGLPQIWQDIPKSQSLEVITPNTDDPNNPYFVDPKYTGLTEEIFLSTREGIDLAMADKGLVDMSALPKTIIDLQNLGVKNI